MDVHIGSKDGPSPSVANTAEQCKTEIESNVDQWVQTLVDDPQRFGDLEHEIHLRFGKMADHTIAAVLARASEGPRMREHEKKLGFSA